MTAKNLEIIIWPLLLRGRSSQVPVATLKPWKARARLQWVPEAPGVYGVQGHYFSALSCCSFIICFIHRFNRTLLSRGRKGTHCIALGGAIFFLTLIILICSAEYSFPKRSRRSLMAFLHIRLFSRCKHRFHQRSHVLFKQGALALALLPPRGCAGSSS